MKKIISAALLLFVHAAHAQAQSMPVVLDSIGEAYQGIVRIQPGYIAALREGALDIRAAAPNAFGTVAASVPLPGVQIVNGFIATTGSTVYAIGNELTPVDVSAPTAPATGTALALPGPATGLHIWGDLLILGADFKTYIYSIANPAAPVLLDSLNDALADPASYGSRLYARKTYGQYVYSYHLSATAPYLMLSDSTSLHDFLVSIDLTGNQLLARNVDTLYRYDLTAADDFQLLAAEALPGYAYNGRLTAIDTNYIGFSLYNSFWMSYGHTGNSFTDSFALGYGDYYVGKGRLDGSVFYADVQSTRLIGFAGASSVAQPSSAMDVALYPNPVSDVLWVSAPQGSDCSYAISDMRGATLLTGTLGSSGKIHVESLPAGFYLLRVRSARGVVYSKKIVKR